MYHPTRGGVRGGADQFNWEDIKIDKHRESYLGHSLKAPVGRWQKGKDLTWYNKDRSEKTNQKPSARCELENIKKAEEEAMLVALGHKPVNKRAQLLTKEELAQVFKKGQTERDPQSIERVEGIGNQSVRLMTVSNAGREERKTVIAEVPLTSDETKKKADKAIGDLRTSEKKEKNSKKKKKKHKKRKKKQYRRDADDSGEHSTPHLDSRCMKEQPRSKRRRHDSSE
ncbi:multiple myeloma tumor-associated protein 2 homolog [Limulus polyphemus]|uniref:Multiple myeloma tumor-associated protein 2 homolog n=1 Tax=Limulus polyphemus TaxID=6850 RepID=A0ABM1BMU7_LIMPO|nr:multiple myeloma tumor-associated protein 2 homolog [Limulus polyphemus]XP_013785178.1 multiple myeloma tumor-associated protein 2 homolog [Limulus polyphemus]XP_013785180.1 multiple myeloma tumor-associated protein 2 homolog [Limulus polyphemus]XP_013785181.1 multiple myeloma tumor-associated protein 2 homolog [Limulus polyphemus]